jgi:hypothetical protein
MCHGHEGNVVMMMMEKAVSFVEGKVFMGKELEDVYLEWIIFERNGGKIGGNPCMYCVSTRA